MAHTAVVTFTARDRQSILEARGSGDWRLNADRARRSEFLVCTQNRHNPDPAFAAPTAPHGAAFLIGRVADVVRSPNEPDRWIIKISEYTDCNIPNIWRKSGHLRYPVRYTTLEELGIDLGLLPPFRPLTASGSIPGMRDMSGPPIIPPRPRLPGPAVAEPQPAAGQDPWERLDAILHQIDLVPDRPAPFEPLEWDAHGLPR
jgi:hypothetical protein